MDSYIEFINDLITIIPEIDTEKNILSIYLGGSVSRGDYVVGISDIDIYIVVNDGNNTASINKAIEEMAIEKLPQLLSWCPDGVTVAFTTYNEIKTGKSWLGSNSEYLSFQETGKLLYGKDIKHKISKPNENDIVKASQQAIEQLKQIIKQDVLNINMSKYLLRGIFSTAFSAMYFYLCLNKIYVRGKVNLTMKFCEVNSMQSEKATSILHLWTIFSQRQLTEPEINKLVFDTVALINEL